MADSDTASETQRSWSKWASQSWGSFRAELTPQKLWNKILFGDKLKEFTFKAGFTSFFSTLFLAYTAPYLWYFMGALIAVDAYSFVRNSAEAAIRKYAGNGFFSNFILQPLSEVVIAATALTFVVGGLVLGAVPLAVSVPFVFMGIMGLRTYQHWMFSRSEKERYLAINEHKNTLKRQDHSNLDQYFDTDLKKEDTISYLVDKKLAEAYFGLKKLLELRNLEAGESQEYGNNNLSELNKAGKQDLKEKIITSLDLISEENLPLTQALKRLQQKIIQECLKKYEISPLNPEGSFNNTFFNDKATIVRTLDKSANNSYWSMWGHRATSLFLGGVGLAIGIVLGPFEPLVASAKISTALGATTIGVATTVVATAGLAIWTAFSGKKIWNAVFDKNVELTPSNSGSEPQNAVTFSRSTEVTSPLHKGPGDAHQSTSLLSSSPNLGYGSTNGGVVADYTHSPSGSRHSVGELITRQGIYRQIPGAQQEPTEDTPLLSCLSQGSGDLK